MEQEPLIARKEAGVRLLLTLGSIMMWTHRLG
jgi:hypothetical protein